MNATSATQVTRERRGWALLILTVALAGAFALTKWSKPESQAGDAADAVTEIIRRGGEIDHTTIPPTVTFRNAKNDSLRFLLELDGMVSLDLRGARITDAGLEVLQQLPRADQLEVLDVANTRISDQGVRCLDAFRRLRSLNLSGTRVSSSGLVTLQDFPSLRLLTVDVRNLNAESLSILAKCNQLNFLFLKIEGAEPRSGTQERAEWIDSMLPHFAAMENLYALELSGNSLTDDELAKLQAAMPNCTVRTQANAS